MKTRLAIGIPTILVVLLALLIGSFFLVPRERLNTLIAEQLTDAFGHKVTVEGKASVNLVPYLSVGFGPLRIEGREDGAPDLMIAERAYARLSVTSLWEGNPAIRFLQLERAEINLIKGKDGQSNWSASSFFTTKDDEENAPSLRFPERLRFIELIDSSLRITDPELARTALITDLNANIVGPPRASALQMDGSFAWEGEKVSFDSSLDEPGSFMAGTKSTGAVELSSALGSLIFRGDLTWEDNLLGDGSLEINTPSPKKLINWLGFASADILPDNDMRILGDGTFTSNRLVFRPIAIRMADGKADGRFEIGLDGKALSLSGTLAFDTLGFGAEPQNFETIANQLVALSFAGSTGATVDIRLSADNASFGDLEIQDVATTVVLSDENFSISLGNARSGNTIVDGSLTASSSDIGHRVSSSITLQDTTFAQLQMMTGLEFPVTGNAEVTIDLKAEGETSEAIIQNLFIRSEVNAGEGIISGLSLDEIWEETLKAEDVNGSSLETAFDNAKMVLTADKANGGVIEELSVVTTQSELNGQGRVDLSTLNLTLSASAQKVETDSDANTSKELTISGPIASPEVTSVGEFSLYKSLNGQ